MPNDIDPSTNVLLHSAVSMVLESPMDRLERR